MRAYKSQKISLSQKNENIVGVDLFFMHLIKDMSDHILDNVKVEGNPDNLGKVIFKIQELSNYSEMHSDLCKIEFITTLNDFHEALQKRNEIFSTHELCIAINKLYAMYAGTCLSNLYFSNPDNEKIKAIDEILSKGV